MVSAIGIGTKPSILDLELRVGQPKKTNILVYNISNEPGIFQVLPEELKNWIEIEPSNFRLESGENQKVQITFLAKGDGIKRTNLSVLAKPLDRRSFSINSGIKVPVQLNIQGEDRKFLASISSFISENSIWIAVVPSFLLASFLLIKYSRKKNKREKKKSFSPPENLPVR